jgi:hypothetical protein
LSVIRWPYLMGAIARRLLGDARAPSPALLWTLWLIAPRRRATYPLLRRALAAPAVMAPPPVLARDADVLASALQAHAECLLHPGDAALLAAGERWDAVRDSEAILALFARRALAFGAKTTAGGALAHLLDTARRDLAPSVARAHPSLLTASETLADAARRGRAEAMDEIEELARAMARRTASKTPLHVSSEWMEWGALRSACERVAREAGDEVRRAVFVTVYAPACNYAVWLFNVREEKLLANGIFRWLAAEAKVLRDAAALKVLEKNVRAGEGI